MKSNRKNLHLLALISLGMTSSSAFAASLTWDTVAGDTTSITGGGGTWDTSATAWNDAGADVVWSQTSTTDGSNAAIFGGTDGTLDQYEVALGSQMAAESLTFNSNGYKLTGGTLSVMVDAATNGAITVAAGKTATINSILRYNDNKGATITSNAGSILNLGGSTTALFNPQMNLAGAGTINITGTYGSTVGTWKAKTMNQTTGTVNMIQGGTTPVGHMIGRDGVQDQTYTISGGVLNVGGKDITTPGYFLGLGRTMGNFKATLIVKDSGAVNIGTTADRSGQLNLGSHDGNGNSLLDMQGGTLTIGTGKATNRLLFFAAGSGANKTATMTQSGGVVTSNGIQFGANTGAANVDGGGSTGANGYDPSSLATLQLNGGSLYVGQMGILRGTAAGALPVSIKLQGGVLGASDNWSSSLDMKLGSAGVEIKAADSLDAAKNITLSGILSDEASLGKLTKTGAGTLTLTNANTYTGATTVTGGTLALSGTASLASSSITVAAGATYDVTGVTGGYTLGSGQTLSGTGTVAGAMNVTGTLSPGNSPGLMTSASQTWLNGGDYNWQMQDATGAAGTGFDQIQVTGTLDLSSLTAGGFEINLWSLASVGPDVNGNAVNFNNLINQSWTILTTSGGITGFNATEFVINAGAANGTGGFSNDLGGGAFSLGASGNNLVLSFTAVPEPNVAALVGVVGLLVLARRRRN